LLGATLLAPDPEKVRESQQRTGEWQDYDITKVDGLIVVRHNGVLILKVTGPVGFDGWIGLRARVARLRFGTWS
jgi:hypothetical protein